MTDKQLIIRDFFYLDVDRVRSLLAQLREGIPEAFEKTRVHRGEGGIKVGLSLDYAYERAESETRSIHHYIYSILEETLEETGRLQVVGGGFPIERWTAEGLPDGCLVLATGRIRLLDFEKITEAMESMPRIFDVAQRFERLSSKEEPGAGSSRRRERGKATREQSSLGIDRKDLRSIVEVVRELYSDTLRLKLFPFDGDRSHYLVGNLTADHLQQPRSNLWLTGGVESQSEWRAMGIVNQLVAADPATADLPANPTLEDHLEQLLLAFSAIARVAASVELPALSFTPLAVYRHV